MRYVKIKSIWQGHRNCADCTIRQSTVFADLEGDDLALLHERVDHLDFPRGAVLFHMGAAPDGLHIIRDGAVKLVRYTPDGDQRIVRVVRPYDVVGLEAALGEAYDCTAVAVTPVSVCRVALESVARLMDDTPRLHRKLMERWHVALSEADAWLAELAGGTTPVRTRIARLLLRLRTFPASAQIYRFPLEDIGAMLGITVETASRVLSQMRRDGVLVEDEGRRTYLADVARLEQIAEGESY